MMKFRSRLRLSIYLVVATVAALTTLASCGEDRWPAYAVYTGRDQWIYETMSANYLWSEEMPDIDGLNLFSAPSTFLQSIVYSTSDKSYSSVDTIKLEEDASYGFTYTLQRNTANDTAYYALLTRVIPDSPAGDAGLDRGDWIMLVDGEVITSKNAKTLLEGTAAMKLSVGRYTTTVTEDGNSYSGVHATGTVTVAEPRPVEEDVVERYTVFTTEAGRRVGYLLYNSFTSGTAEDSEKYANQLREASNYFAQQGISTLIIDLRYNTGGTFADSQLLASLVAPTAYVEADAPYATLTYGTNRSADNHTLTFSKSLIGSGTNLNISQGIILTGSSTKAAVAGTFLNCLAPLSRWALVGTDLSCWGVATERFESADYNWRLNAVVATVANSEGETGANGSFTPNSSVSETKDLSRVLPLGNPEEMLISAAIALIEEL
jgi:hypothetical protein